MTSRRIASLLLLAAAVSVAACSVVGESVSGLSDGDGGVVECGTGLALCAGVCSNLANDPAHCGTCGNSCPATQVCAAGDCSDDCPAGQTNCDGACANLDSDSMNCGSCGTPCAGVCVGGSCQGGCTSGTTECSGTCVDVMTDAQNCGDCGNDCTGGRTCVSGACDCAQGQTVCDGTCADTASSVVHCGRCDNACASGEQCVAGQCEVSCPSGQTACSGACIDLANNNLNCGRCGNACGPGEVCGNGVCQLTCPLGLTACAGSCVDTETDSTHCGACDDPCDANEECRAGVCRIACDTMLNSPIVDPWGDSWDGLERADATHDAARAACEAIGGRLPTATELFRVSATQTASVGQTIHTNWLWSHTPHTEDAQTRVRLSDGLTATESLTNDLRYRCICPGTTPRVFDESACHGTPGAACTAIAGEGGHYNVDNEDRASVSVMGAVFECSLDRGHLIEARMLVEAIQQGLPNGSYEWLATADGAQREANMRLRWDATNFSLPNDLSQTTHTTRRAFRCAGRTLDPGPHPTSIADEWVGPLGRKSTISDETMLDPMGMSVPNLMTFPAVHDLCWSRGGHVPRATELAELVQAGLPGGSDSWLWTSDQSGRNTSEFHVQRVRWTGEDLRFSYRNDSTATINWIAKQDTTLLTARCIYYPVDSAYTGPAACNGGCSEFVLPSGSGARLWLDSIDRAPPAVVTDAIRTCWEAGGHLASARDLMEAIRAGLANGSDTRLHTSDFVYGRGAGAAPRNAISSWVASDPTYDDFGAGWGSPDVARPYRCMWTNELR